MVSLLHYIEGQFPFWRFLNRSERTHALHGILPTVDIGVEPINGLADTRPLVLLDTHVSLDSHYTRIRTSRGMNTVLSHARIRLGYAPDVEQPLVRSRGGCLHVLESLVVI